MQHLDSASHDVQMVLDRAGDLLSNFAADDCVGLVGRSTVARAADVSGPEGREFRSVRCAAFQDERGLGTDFVATVVEVGVCSAQYLRVMLGCLDSVAEAYTLIPTVVDRAESYGSASQAAVGCAASLVGVIAAGDERELAAVVAAARDDFGCDDIARAVSALIASITEQIAELTGLDTAMVHVELSSRLGHRTAHPARVRRHATIDGSADRQMCIRRQRALAAIAGV